MRVKSFRLNAKQRRMIHLLGMLLWFINGVIAAMYVEWGWKLYLLEISIYANFVGHWSGFSAETPVEIERKPDTD